MKRNITLITAAFGLLALLLAGCEQPTDSNGDGSSGDSAPSAQITESATAQEVQSTQTTLADQNDTDAQSVSGLLSFTSLFQIWAGLADPDYQQYGEDLDDSDSTWKYSYTRSDGVTVTLVFNEESNRYTWKLTYDGTTTINNTEVTYSSWIVFEGRRSKDASTGQYTIYDKTVPNENRPLFEGDWEEGSLYTWNFTEYKYSSGNLSQKDTYDVVLDPDADTGELDYIERNYKADGTTIDSASEDDAGWENNGADGIWRTDANDKPSQNSWGSPSASNPDEFIKTDSEPSFPN